LRRQALSEGEDKSISPQQLKKLLFFLGWQIRARLRFGKYAIPASKKDQVELINEWLTELYWGYPNLTVTKRMVMSTDFG
jgi:hypothetical protein